MNEIKKTKILCIAFFLISGCLFNDEDKSEDKFCSDGNITFQSKMEFDNKSRIIEMGFWSSFDNKWSTTKTQYNEDGTYSIKNYSDGLLTSTECQYSKIDSSTYTVSLYSCLPASQLLALGKYDSLWREIQSTFYNTDYPSIESSKTEYEYDDETKTFKTYEFIDGVRTLDSKTYLDEKNNSKKIERHEEDSTKIKNIEFYEYNPEFIESKKFEGDKNTEITRGYLDDKGNVTKTFTCTL